MPLEIDQSSAFDVFQKNEKTGEEKSIGLQISKVVNIYKKDNAYLVETGNSFYKLETQTKESPKKETDKDLAEFEKKADSARVKEAGDLRKEIVPYFKSIQKINSGAKNPETAKIYQEKYLSGNNIFNDFEIAYGKVLKPELTKNEKEKALDFMLKNKEKVKNIWKKFWKK